MFAWSPTLPILLVVSEDQTQKDANFLMKPAGGSVTLPLPCSTQDESLHNLKIRHSKVIWSPCGRYISICHGRFDDRPNDPFSSTHVGKLWDSFKGETVHVPVMTCGVGPFIRFFWSRCGNRFLALHEDCSSLVILPEGLGAATHHTYQGRMPRDMTGLNYWWCMGFSPCGKALWLFESLKPLDDEKAVASSQAANARGECLETEPVARYRLWQGKVDSEHPQCSPGHSLLVEKYVHMENIAWHPNPQFGCIFAVAAECGDLFLLGTSPPRVIHTWAFANLQH